MTADRPSIHQTATIEHDEETIAYIDAWRKKAHYAGGVHRYVAKRVSWVVAEASRWPWLGYPRTPLTRNGVRLVALKLCEATAVCWALADAQARRLCAGRSGRGPVLRGSCDGR